MSDSPPELFDRAHGRSRGRHGDDDTPPTMIPLIGEIRASTDKAIQFYDGSKTVWLPRSQCAIADDGTVSVAEWLAQKNGLV